MPSVFGDCSQQGIPVTPVHTQEPQGLDTVPCLFGESNYLISFLDHFETGLAIEQRNTHGLDHAPFKKENCTRVADVHVKWLTWLDGTSPTRSRQQRSLAHDRSHTLKTGFGKTRAALALKGFGQWDAI
ncbi:hypothetical protein TNCV_2827881 [Trichonephila clavipes]|nr:hypothetical protein TNCV_2827881 [Trichonephila clavipes]